MLFRDLLSFKAELMRGREVDLSSPKALVLATVF